MYQLIMLIHVFAAVFIIALVLVQQGKGAVVGAAFGSGASQTVFGSRGSGSFMFRLTASLVGIFFITSIALNYIVTSTVKHEKAAVTLPFIPVKKSVPSSLNTTKQMPSQVEKGLAVEQTPVIQPTVGSSPGDIPQRK